MTSSGSVNNGGCIFKITPSGQYTIIRSLSINTDGGRPQGRLIQATDGNFYGINNAGGSFGYGTIFKLTTANAYTVLKSFNGTTDGASSYGSLVQGTEGVLYGIPKAGLVQGTDGAFFGTTSTGGTSGVGAIFRITTTPSFSVLRQLNMATDGGAPLSGFIIAPKIALVANPQSNLATNEDGDIFL